jgi:early secretory antigenic target protein ESAT-6
MTISVNHKALELAAQDMVAKAKDIKGVLDSLDQDIRNDVMAWGGQAKSAYIPAKTQWDQSLVAMINHLQDAATGVSNANSEYYTTDQKNAGLFEGIPKA